MRYRAWPASSRSNASLMRLIGKCSVCGVMLCRAANSSIVPMPTGGPIGEPEKLLPRDERDHRERDRFKHEADDVQPAVGSQRGDERVPIERDIDGDEQQVEYPRQFLDRVRIAARHDSMRTELPGF